MQIAHTTAPGDEPAPDARRVPAEGPARRPLPDAERPLRTAVEPRARTVAVAPIVAPVVAPTIAPPAPRWIEPERDYRAPSAVERARLLRAAYEAAIPDPEQRLLLAELMAYFRSWCLRQGHGDPFVPETHAAHAALRAD